MGLPKRKTNIKVYGVNQNTDGPAIVGRRKELLEDIIKSDTFLPDSILHDDLDLGMLEFVQENFKVISEGEQIPVIPKILTIQRWGEYTNNWSFSDDDGNIKLPFIAVVRKPDVQLGTNPSIQRTIPDRRDFFYASVPTWDGNQMGADIYKIPQPIAVDISFDVTIVCTKFRDVNKFNQKVLQKFSSRQAYTRVKGHYIPIVLDRIEDNTPMDTMDGRRFYIQNYSFTMLGFLIDDEEFDVSPAIARSILMTEVDTRTTKLSNKSNPITITSSYSSGSIVADYTAVASFKVDKTTKISFNDVLDKTNGATVIIPVDIFIEPNQISGTTQYTINENYGDLTLTNSFSGITSNTIGRSKYNFSYETSSSFEPPISPTPTPTQSVTPSLTQTPTPSTTPTPSMTSTVTPTPSITPSESVTPTPSITPSESVTPTPSLTQTPSTSVTPTVTPTITPSNTVTPSVTRTITPTPSVTRTVTPTSSPTPTPTLTPFFTPSPSPTPLPDESILVAGFFDGYNGLSTKGPIRLNSDGSIDSTFSGSTLISPSFGSVSVIEKQSDNKVLVGGQFTSYSGVSRNYIVRLISGNTIDNTFSIGTGFNNVIKTIRVQSDGKILVGGFFTSYSGVSYNRIIRLNSNGSIDNTFSIGTGFNSYVNNIEIQSDGKIVVVGDFTSFSGSSYNRIIRLNSNGSIDDTFSIGTGFNSTVNSLKLQSDGKIVTVGGFTSYSGVTKSRIIRLNTDGSIDNTFDASLGNNSISNLDIQPDGKIIPVGQIEIVNSQLRNGIVRLNSDGSIDNTFNIGTGFASLSNTNSVKVQTNGKIIVGGEFTLYNGTSINRIVRLNSDGSIDNTFNIGTGFAGTPTTIILY